MGFLFFFFFCFLFVLFLSVVLFGREMFFLFRVARSQSGRLSSEVILTWGGTYSKHTLLRSRETKTLDIIFLTCLLPYHHAGPTKSACSCLLFFMIFFSSFFPSRLCL